MRGKDGLGKIRRSLFIIADTTDTGYSLFSVYPPLPSSLLFLLIGWLFCFIESLSEAASRELLYGRDALSSAVKKHVILETICHDACADDGKILSCQVGKPHNRYPIRPDKLPVLTTPTWTTPGT